MSEEEIRSDERAVLLTRFDEQVERMSDSSFATFAIKCWVTALRVVLLPLEVGEICENCGFLKDQHVVGHGHPSGCAWNS